MAQLAQHLQRMSGDWNSVPKARWLWWCACQPSVRELEMGDCGTSWPAMLDERVSELQAQGETLPPSVRWRTIKEKHDSILRPPREHTHMYVHTHASTHLYIHTYHKHTDMCKNILYIHVNKYCFYLAYFHSKPKEQAFWTGWDSFGKGRRGRQSRAKTEASLPGKFLL